MVSGNCWLPFLQLVTTKYSDHSHIFFIIYIHMLIICITWYSQRRISLLTWYYMHVPNHMYRNSKSYENFTFVDVKTPCSGVCFCCARLALQAVILSFLLLYCIPRDLIFCKSVLLIADTVYLGECSHYLRVPVRDYCCCTSDLPGNQAWLTLYNDKA